MCSTASRRQGPRRHAGTVVRIGLELHRRNSLTVTLNQATAGRIHASTPTRTPWSLGPTGVGLGRGGVLYVADSAGNRIAAIPRRPDALDRDWRRRARRSPRGQPLNDPLGLTIAPDGDVLQSEGGDGRSARDDSCGHRPRAGRSVPNGGGDLFGLALIPGGRGLVRRGRLRVRIRSGIRCSHCSDDMAPPPTPRGGGAPIALPELP